MVPTLMFRGGPRRTFSLQNEQRFLSGTFAKASFLLDLPCCRPALTPFPPRTAAFRLVEPFLHGTRIERPSSHALRGFSESRAILLFFLLPFEQGTSFFPTPSCLRILSLFSLILDRKFRPLFYARLPFRWLRRRPIFSSSFLDGLYLFFLFFFCLST